MTSTLSVDDARNMLAAGVHLGNAQMNHQMRPYSFGRARTGANIIRLDKTWNKLVLAARAICAVENPSDVAVVGTRSIATRAVLKFSKYTSSFPFAGRFTPGTFTNQIQKAFREPRLLLISCTLSDRQAVNEARYVNIPVVSLCDMNSDLRYVDIAIPCNTRSAQSVGLIWWMLCREVLRMRGAISRDVAWDVMTDLFIYREPEEVNANVEEEQQQQAQAGQGMITAGAGYDSSAQPEMGAVGGDMTGAMDDWGAINTDWGAAAVGGNFGAVGEQPAAGAAPPAAGFVAPAAAGGADEWAHMKDDWN